jgi:hypothetical protein
MSGIPQVEAKANNRFSLQRMLPEPVLKSDDSGGIILADLQFEVKPECNYRRRASLELIS